MFLSASNGILLGLVLVLLPREEDARIGKLRNRLSEAGAAATAAVSDMSQFCKRQPAALPKSARGGRP